MSAPSLVARLGLTTEEFTRGLNASEAGLTHLQNTSRVTAAQVALLEQAMARAGGGTATQVAELHALNTSLRLTQAECRATAQQVQALNAVSAQGGGLALNQNGKRLRKGVTGAEGMLLNAASGGDAVSTATGLASMLPLIFSMSMPAMLGIGAGVVLAKSIHSAVQEGAKLKAESKAAMEEGNATGTGFKSEKILSHQSESLSKELDDALSEKQSIAGKAWDKLRDGYRSLTGGKSVEDERSDNIEALYQKRLEVGNQLVTMKKDELSLDERAFHMGDEAVAADREKLRLKKEMADVANNKNLDGSTQVQLIALLREESRLRTEIQEHKLKSLESELALETQLVTIRALGRNVPSESAVANLERARKELDNGPKQGAEHERLQNRVTDAETNFHAVQRQGRNEDTDLETRHLNASLHGSAADIAYRQALNQVQAIEKKLNDGDLKHDDAKRLQIEREEAEQRLQAATRALGESAYKRAQDGIDANRHDGHAGEVGAIDGKIGLKRQELDANARDMRDPDVAARLNKEIAELQRRKTEIREADAKSLRDAKANTAELTAQLNGETSVAAQTKVRAQYEEKITAAKKDGNAELAAELQKAERLAILAAQIADAKKTPEQRAQERAAGVANAHAAYQAQFSHTRDSAREGSAIHDADKEGSVIGNADKTGGRAYNAPENAGWQTFDQRFRHAIMTLPDRRPEIRGGADNAGRGDNPVFNDANICGKLDAIKGSLDHLSLTNQP